MDGVDELGSAVKNGTLAEHDALRMARAARRIEHEEHVLGVHGFGRAFPVRAPVTCNAPRATRHAPREVVVLVAHPVPLAAALEADAAAGLRRSTLARFTADMAEAVDVVERNLRRAAELLTGFKQVAVDQSSHQRRTFELGELMRELNLALSPTLKQRQVQLTDRIAPGLVLDSHPGPLSQVLMNLVNNAVVHAFEGHAAPQITVEALPHGDEHVHITLQDNGCGIAPEHLQRVFDPFFTTRLGRGGSGLGLHIVYSLVTELLGGRVQLDSAPGQGCTITLVLPRVAPDRRDAAEFTATP